MRGRKLGEKMPTICLDEQDWEKAEKGLKLIILSGKFEYTEHSGVYQVENPVLGLLEKNNISYKILSYTAKTLPSSQEAGGQEGLDSIESDIKIMERRISEQEDEIVKLEALRRFRDSTEKFLSSHDISGEQKVAVLSKTASLVHDIFEASQQNIPFEEILQQKAQALQPKTGDIFVHRTKPEGVGQAPDLSEIPQWQGRKKDGMPLDFIQSHYGQFLSAFGAEQDNIFQDQIRAHDPRLIKGANNQLQEEGKGRKLRELVKTRSARVDRELESINSTYLKQAQRLSTANRRRQARGQTSRVVS